MKPYGRTLTIAGLAGHADELATETSQIHLLSITAAQDAPPARPAESWALGWKVAGVLAFGQSLLFLALWLWLCASAGAATPAPAEETEYRTIPSTYAPIRARDPFVKTGVRPDTAKVLPSGTVSFQLQGILYQGDNSSAIINDTLVTLNKTVTLSAGTSEIQIKAVEIGREHVVLEAGGQRVELHLNPQDSAAGNKPK